MFLVLKLSKKVQALQQIVCAGKKPALCGAVNLTAFLFSFLSRETAQETIGKFCSDSVVGRIKGCLVYCLGDGKQLIIRISFFLIFPKYLINC